VRPSSALALLVFAACGGRADDTLRVVELPGFDVALPGWSERHRGNEWASDRVVLEDGQNTRALMLQWSPTAAAWTEADLEVAFGAARAAYPGLELGPEWSPVTIGGHEGADRSVHVGAISGRVATWFCPEHRRQVLVFSIGPKSLYDGVLGGVRCHARPAPAGATEALFAAFDPPAGMSREPTEDPATQTWRSDEVVMVLTAGSQGDLLEATLLASQGDETVRAVLRLAALGEPGAITRSRIEGRDGVERAIFSTVTRSDDGSFDVRVSIWHCPDLGRTFAALHMAQAGKIDPYTAEQHLLRATCPAR